MRKPYSMTKSLKICPINYPHVKVEGMILRRTHRLRPIVKAASWADFLVSMPALLVLSDDDAMGWDVDRERYLEVQSDRSLILLARAIG